MSVKVEYVGKEFILTDVDGDIIRFNINDGHIIQYEINRLISKNINDYKVTND